MKTYENACKAVAEWWAEKTFYTPNNQDNGVLDPAPNLLMEMAASQRRAGWKEPQIAMFTSALYAILLRYKDKPPYTRDLFVDYNPCQELEEAAQLAGMKSAPFPIKSGTKIGADNIPVGVFGYRGKFEEIPVPDAPDYATRENWVFTITMLAIPAITLGATLIAIGLRAI